MRKHKVKLLSITDAIPIIGSRSNPADTVFIKQTNSYNIIDIYVTDSTGLCVGGKTQNLGNTDLTLTSARTLDTNNLPFFITKKPNKSIDPTFNRFVVEDVNGQQAYVDNSYNILMASLDDWTSAEKLAFARKINNDAQAGTMSIGAIYPSVIPLENYENTFIVSGSNFNLSQESRSIEIINADTNIVVKTIPGNFITVNNNNEFTFRSNNYSLGAGTFKIRVWSGLLTTTSEQTIQQLESVNHRDLTALTWDVITSPNYINNSSYFSGTAVSAIQDYVGGIPIDTTFLSAKSSPAFYAGEDWFVELSINQLVSSNENLRQFTSEAKDLIGIMYSSTPNSLFELGIVKYNKRYYNPITLASGHSFYINNNVLSRIQGYSAALNPIVTILKQGNVMKISSMGQTSTVTISNNEDYSFIAQLVSRTTAQTSNQLSYVINKSYVIN